MYIVQYHSGTRNGLQDILCISVKPPSHAIPSSFLYKEKNYQEMSLHVHMHVHMYIASILYIHGYWVIYSYVRTLYISMHAYCHGTQYYLCVCYACVRAHTTCARFGTGMVVYWFGYIEEVDVHGEQGIILADQFPPRTAITLLTKQQT